MERVTGLPALLRHGRLSLLAAVGLSILWTTSGDAALVHGVGAHRTSSHVAPCSTLADSIPGTSGNAELLTVIAPSPRSRTAIFQMYRRTGTCFESVAGPYAAYVGINGVSARHREGDLTTPIGLFGIETTMYGVNPNPGVTYRYHQLTCGDWWDEDPRSALYNHFAHVRCGTTPPFAGNSEALWMKVPAYDYFAVVNYNTSPVVPGRGSAIFLHVSKGAPTTGCVSIAKVHLVKVLRLLRTSDHPVIYINTRASLQG
jgi:L,D-peptidoglycan transpeptidase YkuD (ErfK/YbiS/YcfS/YnhG family)